MSTPDLIIGWAVTDLRKGQLVTMQLGPQSDGCMEPAYVPPVEPWTPDPEILRRAEGEK